MDTTLLSAAEAIEAVQGEDRPEEILEALELEKRVTVVRALEEKMDALTPPELHEAIAALAEDDLEPFPEEEEVMPEPEPPPEPPKKPKLQRVPYNVCDTTLRWGTLAYPPGARIDMNDAPQAIVDFWVQARAVEYRDEPAD